MNFGGMDHHQPNGVVDDAERSKLPIDAIGGLASQDVHPHRRLQMTQVGLDLPPTTVKFDNGLFGIPIGIEQRGDKCHLS